MSETFAPVVPKKTWVKPVVVDVRAGVSTAHQKQFLYVNETTTNTFNAHFGPAS